MDQKLVIKEKQHDIFDLRFFFHESTRFLIHTLNYFHMGLIHEKTEAAISCYCPFKIL
jgi:hypothetical protein